MTWNVWVGNAISIVGIILNMLIYQQKDRAHLLRCKLLADSMALLSYLFLLAYTGAVVAALGMIRSIVFINRTHHKWASNPAWMYIFLALVIVSGIFTWKSIFSLLPMAASIISVISFWIGKPRISRILSFPISGLMMSYDFTVQAYIFIIGETMTIISSVLGIIRNDIKKSTADT